MKKILLLIFVSVVFNLSASAQSGVGGLKGLVTRNIWNNSAIEATVELRVIENHSGTNTIEKMKTKSGYYEFEVSFGYYLLTISAEGYETYRTKVYIPPSSTLEWATILEKSVVKPKNK